MAAFAAPALAVDRNVLFINETGRDLQFVGFNPPGDEAFGGVVDNHLADALGGDLEAVTGVKGEGEWGRACGGQGAHGRHGGDCI